MNHATVPVHRRPKVAVLATGDELVMPGGNPGPGEIVYSNGYATMAMPAPRGLRGYRSRHRARPDRRDRRGGAARARRAATSSSPPAALRSATTTWCRRRSHREGLALSFWKIALRPGQPMMHGRLGAMHVLGMPGNPVSAYVCAVLFLVPLIRRLCGRSDIAPEPEQAVLGWDLPANDERATTCARPLRPAPMASRWRRRPPYRTVRCSPPGRGRLPPDARRARAGRQGG